MFAESLIIVLARFIYFGKDSSFLSAEIGVVMYIYMWMHARDITVLYHDIAGMSGVLLLFSLDICVMYYALTMPARYM